ncbi:hypothetical protein ADK70_04465 [Streptomyces rimosus subsp. pseudoverticillatus]|nr:hypothetical protein ADK70_04465 [Streptomyces rimosus subsp. pseudoverticillatus]
MAAQAANGSLPGRPQLAAYAGDAGQGDHALVVVGAGPGAAGALFDFRGQDVDVIGEVLPHLPGGLGGRDAGVWGQGAGDGPLDRGDIHRDLAQLLVRSDGAEAPGSGGEGSLGGFSGADDGMDPRGGDYQQQARDFAVLTVLEVVLLAGLAPYNISAAVTGR